MELNGLAVKLQAECKPETCTQVKLKSGSGMYPQNKGKYCDVFLTNLTLQMTATEQWIFLCAAHKTPKECPAIGSERIFEMQISKEIHNLDNNHDIHRLHSAHIGRSRVSPQQQQVLPQQGLHQGHHPDKL